MAQFRISSGFMKKQKDTELWKGKKIDGFQIFDLFRPGVAKWQHICFVLCEYTE